MALQMLRRCLPHAVSFWAPPCGSWVFLNRGTAKRSADNPYGDTTLPYIVLNNRLVARIVLLLRFAALCSVYWCLEPPSSSLLMHHPKLKHASVALGLQKTFLWMMAYGGESPKGTHLWGNLPYLSLLGRSMSKIFMAKNTPPNLLTEQQLGSKSSQTERNGQWVCELNAVCT